uniref:Uncharacterized protein n=1 Tax=Utricularia reniformis TaxID=192314 RepID=A0A1Y0B2Z8_9LAMI|nr:hypothetical protein AEK19_MT1579 [Utricularia reniformis]ART31764.1 hypothetical protein AEK19_MT1579 [Utricularia reniformis]
MRRGSRYVLKTIHPRSGTRSCGFLLAAGRDYSLLISLVFLLIFQLSSVARS